jgi:hypothetical protein
VSRRGSTVRPSPLRLLALLPLLALSCAARPARFVNVNADL